MPKQYTVKDTETDKTVTFEWSGDGEPTESDMAEVFSSAKEATAAPAEPKKPVIGEFLKAPEGEMSWKQDRPIRQALSNIYTPTLRMLGLAGGGAIGAAALAPTGPGALYSGVAGSALGHGIGGSTALRLDELTGLREPQSLGQATSTALQDMKTGAMAEMGGQVLNKALSATGSVIDKKLSKTIRRGVEKSIRPSVVGQRTHAQAEGYLNKAEEAVKAIVQNKDALSLTDEFGEAAVGLPKTLKQFSQAVDQTKKIVFDQYNQLTVAAGKKGATVDLSGIAKELKGVAGNTTTTDIVPGLAKYSDDLAERFLSRKSYTVKEAQEAIAVLNSRLESFYKNPSYENASVAYVDSMVANNLRKSLDTVIEQASGVPGYQALKNTYGSLKTIERDVNRRAVVDARKNVKGLVDFFDVLSGADVVSGIMSLNPITVGRGVAVKAMSGLIKRMNDPNRIVGTMFGDVEKMLFKTAAAPISKAATTALPELNIGLKDIVSTKGGKIMPLDEFKRRKIAAAAGLGAVALDNDLLGR